MVGHRLEHKKKRLKVAVGIGSATLFEDIYNTMCLRHEQGHIIIQPQIIRDDAAHAHPAPDTLPAAQSNHQLYAESIAAATRAVYLAMAQFPPLPAQTAVRRERLRAEMREKEADVIVVRGVWFSCQERTTTRCRCAL